MMTDLFGEVAQKQPEVAQEWRTENPARGGCATAPLPPYRGGVAARSGAPSAPSRGVAQKAGVSGARVAQPLRGNKQSFGDLRARAEQLQAEIEEAHAEVETAKLIQDPFQAHFEQIDRRLRSCSFNRYTGSQRYDRDQWFQWLDERVEAGHMWNPHRERLKKAEQWRKAIMDELKAVNEEIGR